MQLVPVRLVFALALAGCGDPGGASDSTGEGSTEIDASGTSGATTSSTTTPTTSASGTATADAGTGSDGTDTGGAATPDIFELFSFQGAFWQLACDADYVYASLSLLNGGSQLWRVAADGSAEPEVIDSDNGYTGLAVEAGNLLYLSGNEVWSYDGSTSTSLATFPTSGTSLTFDLDEADFWVASGTSNVSASFGWVQVPRDGSEVINFGTQMAAQDVLPFNLHLTSTHIAWSRAKFGSPPSSPDLWWVPRTGGDATQFLLPEGQRVTGFDVLGDELYLVVAVNQGADFVQKTVVDGMPANVVDVQGMAGGGLYVDAQHLYYSTYDGDLWRSDIDGEDPIALQEVNATSRIDGCDEYVLFDDSDGMGTTSIYVVVKD